MLALVPFHAIKLSGTFCPMPLDNQINLPYFPILVVTFLKVVLLTNFIPPYRKGLYHAIKNLYPEFRVMTSVLSESNRGWNITPEEYQIIQKTLTFKVNHKHPNGFVDVGDVHFPYDTIPQLLKMKPDVVLSAEFGLRTLQAVLYKWLNPESKLIVWATLSSTSELGRGKLRTWVRKFILSQCDGIITNGKEGQDYLEALSSKHLPTLLVPYTSDFTPQIVEPAFPNDGLLPHLLYIGQLSHRKGVKQLLDGLKDYARLRPERQIKLDLYGKVIDEDILQEIKSEGNLELSYQGEAAYSGIPDIYSRYSVFIFPTLSDEWGLVTNEAMCFNNLVLGSKHSQAVVELIKPDNGLTYDPLQQQTLIEQLDRIAKISAEQYLSMTQKARQTVSGINHSSVAHKLANFINLLVLKPKK